MRIDDSKCRSQTRSDGVQIVPRNLQETAQALILAGGQGSRLHPYTHHTPKALMPLGDTTVLGHLLHQLADAGISRVTLAVGHLAQQIETYCGNGHAWGLDIGYHHENQPLGTAGPILSTFPEDADNLLVLNADIVCNLPFDVLWQHHTRHHAALTLAVAPHPQQLEFGVVSLDAHKRVCSFVEKPQIVHHVCTGISVVHRQVLSCIPQAQPFGFDGLIHAVLANKKPIQAYVFEGYWRDIGRVADYRSAVEEFALLQPIKVTASKAGLSKKQPTGVTSASTLLRTNPGLIRIA
jgi:NDP-sugar pyrophosphorylase family protein